MTKLDVLRQARDEGATHCRQTSRSRGYIVYKTGRQFIKIRYIVYDPIRDNYVLCGWIKWDEWGKVPLKAMMPISDVIAELERKEKP